MTKITRTSDDNEQEGVGTAVPSEIGRNISIRMAMATSLAFQKNPKFQWITEYNFNQNMTNADAFFNGYCDEKKGYGNDVNKKELLDKLPPGNFWLVRVKPDVEKDDLFEKINDVLEATLPKQPVSKKNKNADKNKALDKTYIIDYTNEKTVVEIGVLNTQKPENNNGSPLKFFAVNVGKIKELNSGEGSFDEKFKVVEKSVNDTFQNFGLDAEQISCKVGDVEGLGLEGGNLQENGIYLVITSDKEIGGNTVDLDTIFNIVQPLMNLDDKEKKNFIKGEAGDKIWFAFKVG